MVDASLSHIVAEGLRRAGHDATHVRDHGLQRADDEAVFGLASRDDRVLIAADTDFGAILAVRQVKKPSVLLLRRHGQRRPEIQVTVILANFAAIRDSLEEGCVAVIEENRVRVRPLPIGGAPPHTT